MGAESQTTAAAEPNAGSGFLVDADRLREMASDKIVKRGVDYFRENRVIDLAWDDSAVRGLVEGSLPDSPYCVELSHDHDGELYVECDCPFDWEPVCKHAVAVLLAYSSQFNAEESKEFASAADQALQERVDKARTEVRVKHVSGEPWFGTWSATSLSPTSHYQRSYAVQIRSLQQRANYCSCPDWVSNQLGTCKHIEAVLHKLAKRRKRKPDPEQPPPFPFVHLSWEDRSGPTIRLQRSPGLPDKVDRLLNRYFDAAGAFKGELPDDFFRFRDRVQGNDDILLGEDAVMHVQMLAEDAARQIRGERIRRDIMHSGRSLPGIRAQLYPYQVEGAAFLASRGRALLADDMGLGKTLQAITAAHWLMENADAANVLIVCPASLKHQWAREIERFTNSEVTVIHGGPDLRGAQYRRARGFVVVNYELVLRDLSVINESLVPDLLVLDEAQRIKNWRTKIASTIKLITSRYAFVLTGTPLENRLEDLYSLLQVIDHRVLGPLWRYMIEFHVTNEHGKVLGYRNLSELRRRLAPVMLRRDRALVLEQLPDRIEQRLDVPMTPKQLELHDSAMRNAASLADTAKRRPLTPTEQNRLMAALQQARMACDAAGLVDKETKGAPKLDELTTLLEELCLRQGRKAVIFSQWERMTAMVEEVAKGLKMGCVRLHGGVPTGKRGALLERFRDDDAVRLFISTDAGGVGLNLQSASVLINLDMPWNPAILDQRIARIHRLGQPNKVHVVIMIAADSYEERVAELVGNKRDLFDNVVDSDATEDVVGVSKKLLETVLEDLGGGQIATTPSEDAEQTPKSKKVDADSESPRQRDTSAEDAAVRQTITEIQAAFGPRIERILGTGGGLLVVVDQIGPELDRVAAELSKKVAVALIEPRTLAGLERLGAASPIGETRTLFEAGEQAAESAIPPLLAMAQRKLQASAALIEQDHAIAAMELLASSMVAAAASRANLTQAPALSEAPVWLYSDAIPAGVMPAEQGAAIVRAVSLSSATSVPPHLVQQVLADARQIVGQL